MAPTAAARNSNLNLSEAQGGDACTFSFVPPSDLLPLSVGAFRSASGSISFVWRDDDAAGRQINLPGTHLAPVNGK